MSSLQYGTGLTSILPRSGNYALQAIEGFTMDALNNVIASIPDWLVRLDHLNSQIDTRQAELAALAEYRPPTRSLKPKGSTESLLQPDDGKDSTPQDDKADKTVHTPPLLTKDSVFPSPGKMAPPTGTNSSPQIPDHSPPAVLAPLQRRTSLRLNCPNSPKPTYPTVLRKRKTESLASAESVAPKYRTRSMIIVYYDSAVQLAFEDLVKFISASRNAMRKGKMAARMADMKKIAELEAEPSVKEESPSQGTNASNGVLNSDGQVPKPTVGGIEDAKEDTGLLKLEYVSTRRMGPSRDSPEGVALRNASKLPAGNGRRTFLQTFRSQSSTASAGSFTSIFDELDSGLEWCQSMCEHAAHQFLRDGSCSVEIEGVKGRLAEVKQIAEREAVKVAAANAAAAEKQRSEESTKASTSPEDSRGLKQIQMRRSFNPVPSKALDSSYIEVDDEGFDEEVEDLPPLRWRSAGQLV